MHKYKGGANISEGVVALWSGVYIHSSIFSGTNILRRVVNGMEVVKFTELSGRECDNHALA